MGDRGGVGAGHRPGGHQDRHRGVPRRVATWTATASESTWTNTPNAGATPILASAATFTPGTVTVTGTITATPSTITLATSPATVVAGTAGVGNNTASWNPTISLAIPTSAIAGLWTGTLTQSVS